MLQNLNRKQLRNIKTQIDSSIDHIDFLLSTLSKKNAQEEGILANIGNLDRRQSIQKVQREYQQKVTILSELVQLKEVSASFQNKQISQNEVNDGFQQISSMQEKLFFSFFEAQECTLEEPIVLRCCTRSNWITRYLDEGDCQIFLSNGNKVEIIGVQNGLMTCLDQYNTYHAIQSAQLYDFTELDVQFSKNMNGIKLDFEVQGNKRLYEFNIKEKCRFIAKVEDHSMEMKHIVLLRSNRSEIDQKYEVIWGSYFQSQLTEDVIIGPGIYYMLSIGHESVNNLRLFFKDASVLELKSAVETPFRARQMLMSSFSECLTSKDGFYSDRTVGQEYARSVYIDIGLVIQIYENIYPFQAKFQDQEPIKEDITLLFSDLYTKEQKQNRLRRGERVVKFYGVQAKPAALFVPRKQVRMGNQIMDKKISHSVFK